MKKIILSLAAAAFCVTAAHAAEEKKKRCFTPSQWSRIEEGTRRGAQQLVDSTRGGPAGSN